MYKVTDSIAFKSYNGKIYKGEITRIHISHNYETIIRICLDDAIAAGFDHNCPIEMTLETFKERVTK